MKTVGRPTMDCDGLLGHPRVGMNTAGTQIADYGIFRRRASQLRQCIAWFISILVVLVFIASTSAPLTGDWMFDQFSDKLLIAHDSGVYKARMIWGDYPDRGWFANIDNRFLRCDAGGSTFGGSWSFFFSLAVPQWEPIVISGLFCLIVLRWVIKRYRANSQRPSDPAIQAS